MNNLNLTIPTFSQISNSEGNSNNWNTNLMYEIEYAVVTDFAALQGTLATDVCPKNGEDLGYRLGIYWLKDTYTYLDKNNNEANYVRVINAAGFFREKVSERHIGIRPILPYSLIKDIAFNEEEGEYKLTNSEFSLFPQRAPEQGLQEEIIGRIKHNELKKTSLRVPIDLRKIDENNLPFKLGWLDSYIYQDKIYTFFKAKPCEDYLATNGVTYHVGDEVVAEMLPIRLLNSPKNDLTFFKDIIIGGIQFDKENYFGDFSATNLYTYINKYLIPFIRQGIEFNKTAKTEVTKQKTKSRHIKK